MPSPRAASASSIGGKLVVLVLKGIFTALVVATPLLGVWVASSLAAASNGPVWAVVLAGLLLFPILPVGWDFLARWRKARKRARSGRLGETPKEVLTTGDRLLLRTLALNGAFLAILLATRPEAAFTALAARGDWMLDGHHGPTAEAVRKKLFAAAGGLEWLYDSAHDNPFRKYEDKTPAPGPTGAPSGAATAPPAPSAAPSASSAPTPAPPAAPARWPLPSELHPAVAAIPAEAETSIDSVARFLVDREHDPYLQVKALHDWVADRIAYDVESYLAKRYPPQDAETVFKTRKAVCAGYAQLLTALGRAAGREIAYVVGDGRTSQGGLSGESHAWNAARIDGQWYLIDVTWDSGGLDGSAFKKAYRSDYLLTPPAAFGVNHFPDEPRWQLRERPLSRGDFVRQPLMQPRFWADGFELVSPDRSQVDVHRKVEISVKNPGGLYMLASFEPRAGGQSRSCAVEAGPLLEVHCDLPAAGSWRVHLFGNREQYGSYHGVGQIEANSD